MADDFDFLKKYSPSGPGNEATMPALPQTNEQKSLSPVEEDEEIDSSNDLSFLDKFSITQEPSLSEKAEQIGLGIIEEYPKASFSLLSGIEAAKLGASAWTSPCKNIIRNRCFFSRNNCWLLRF